MEFVYNDGGRSNYYKAANVSDCVTRAICNATGLDYKKVYNDLQHLENTLKVGKHEKQGSARNGIRKKVDSYYIEKVLGWVRVKTCQPGTHERIHLTEDEMPKTGTYIVQLSKHLTCLKDGVIYDTYDCSEKEYYDINGDLQVNNQRLVYGYWRAPTEVELKERNEKLKQNQKVEEERNKKVQEMNTLIEEVNLKYSKDLNKLEKKIKELTHKYKILNNRKKKDILKVKTEFNL